MKKSLVESTLFNELGTALQSVGLSIGQEYLDRVVNSVFRGISSFLGITKKKDKPVALVIKDLKGNYIFGAIVEHFDGEDENDPGNWSLVYSFDKDDIKPEMEVIDVTNSAFQTLYDNITRKHFRFNFKSSEMAWNVIIAILNTLKNWLDSNCKENGEVTELDNEGYFLASVALENGEKVLAIEPSGEMKQLIKDDATLTEE